MGLTVTSILTNVAPTSRLLPPNFPARRSAHHSGSGLFGTSEVELAQPPVSLRTSPITLRKPPRWLQTPSM